MAMAEKLSVPQLQQAIKAGTVPAYVGIPLLQEKIKLQRAMQAQSQTPRGPYDETIADQVMQEADAAGIARLPSNLPLYDTEDLYGETGEEGYARGGIVAFAEGEEVEDPYAVSADGADAAPTTTTVSSGRPTLSSRLPATELSPETQALFKEYGDQLRAQRSGGAKEREQALYMAMIQGGLAAAGGMSPNALQNIAQGATVGFQNYQKSLQEIKKDDRAALKQLLDMGMTKEKFLQEAQKMGVDLYKADKTFEAHKYSADMSYAAAMARASAEKQPRAITGAEIDAAEIERGARVLMQKNPNLSEDEARSQAYQSLLKIKHPDPSNLAGVGALAGTFTSAISSDPDVVAASKALVLANYSQDKEKIAAAQTALDNAKAAAAEAFKARMGYVGELSNRPLQAQTPQTAQTPQAPQAAPAPKLPRGATPNPDGTFNFKGNDKVPAGVYKMNPDGKIIRVK